MIKYLKYIIGIAIFLSGCDYSAETLGGWGDRTFPISRGKLTMAINKLYSLNSQYKVPEKWMDEDSSEIKSYFFLQSMTFYFKENPEEMYYVTFIGDSTMLADSSKTIISVRSVYNGGYYKWPRWIDESPAEQKRIGERFDKEIISKLELYTGTKCIKEVEN